MGKNRLKDIKCPTCNKVFHPRYAGAVYCKRTCMRSCLGQRWAKEKTCDGCGVKFTGSRGGERKFCSLKCSRKFQRKRQKRYVTYKCLLCLKESVVSFEFRNRKVCGMKCRNKYFSGLYKGKKRPKEVGEKISKGLMGKKLSVEHRLALSVSHLKEDTVYNFTNNVRRNVRYSEWRKTIFERDDYTCQICGIRGGKLHVDHIKMLSTIVRELEVKLGRQLTLLDALQSKEIWDLENGRTLCVPCHKKTPTWGRQKTL